MDHHTLYQPIQSPKSATAIAAPKTPKVREAILPAMPKDVASVNLVAQP